MIKTVARFLFVFLLALIPILAKASYDGTGLRVGIIDSGVYKHPDPNEDQGDPVLVGKLVNEKCYSIEDDS